MEIIEMKKLIYTMLFTVLVCFNANAQTENVGIGTSSPDNSAVLHVSFEAISGPKGLLIPRMSTLQRNTIPDPKANGLLIFNTDNNQFEYYDAAGPTWLPLLSSDNIALNSGNIFVGNASNTAASVSMSGDALLDNTGSLTIQDDAIDGTDLSFIGEANGAITYHNGTDWVVLTPGNNGDILAVNAGIPAWQADNSISSTLTAGNILVGDASNVAVSVAMSGDILISETGVVTIQDGAVDGSDISIASEVTGSVLYFNGTEWVTLAPGTDGQTLSLTGGLPVWASSAGGGSLNDAYGNGSTITLAAANGSVVVSGALDSDAALELSNTGLNGVALQVNSGLSKFGNTYTATQASGNGDLIVDNILEVGGEVYLTGLPNAPTFGVTELYSDISGRVYQDNSSRRYKTDISDYNFNYKNILKLAVKKYRLKNDENSFPRIGLIAEELDSLGMKHVISYDIQGRPDGVTYSKISLYLLEVIKQQQNEIDAIRQEVESLKSKIK